MRLTPNHFRIAEHAAENLAPGECVHFHEDGLLSSGTDYESTIPVEPSGIAWTYHPGRGVDQWDRMVRRG